MQISTINVNIINGYCIVVWLFAILLVRSETKLSRLV